MYLSRAVAVLGLTSLVAYLWLGSRELAPPAPRDAGAPADAFSAERAMRHVETIAATQHPIGTEAHAAARRYIVDELTALGLMPVEHTSRVRFNYRGADTLVTVRNVFARIEGAADRDPVVMLVSHYDSAWEAPGAGDDGAGVAAMLEAARALLSGPRPQNDVFLLFTDGEEIALLGAETFRRDDPVDLDVGVVLNFEARGHRGASIMFETSAGNERLVEAMHHVPRPHTSSLFYEAYRRMPNDTDLTVFKRAGMRGMNFAFIGGLSHYHTVWDTPDELDRGSLQHHGDYALALARYFGDADLGALQSNHDPVYFSPLGRGLVTYPAGLAPWWVGLATLLFLTAVVMCLRKRWIRLTTVTIGTLVVPLSAGLSLLVYWAISSMIVESGAVRRFVAPLVEDEERYMIGILLLVMSVHTVVLLVLRTRAKIDSLFTGSLLWWWLASVAVAVVLPLASYLPVWPLAFASLGFIALAQRPRRQRIGVVRASLVLLALTPGVVIYVPVMWGIFLALRLDAGIAVVPGLVLLLGLLTPALLFATSHARWLLPTGTALAGFLLIAHTLLTNRAAEYAVLGSEEPPAATLPPPQVEVARVEGDLEQRTATITCRLPEGASEVTLSTLPRPGFVRRVDGYELPGLGSTKLRYLAPTDREFEVEVSVEGESMAVLVVTAGMYRPPTSFAVRHRVVTSEGRVEF